MSNEQTVKRLIHKAYEKLKALDAEGAAATLEEALQVDFNNEETKHALKSVNWWIEHMKPLEKMQNPYEKGGYLLSLFKQYYIFLENIKGDYDLCQYAIRRYVFSLALKYFEDLLDDGINKHDPCLLLLIGRCYKGVGNYEEALNYLTQAVRFRREDAETLAELADINALLGETRNAKLLFREAFFLNPDKIEIRSMESEMALKLRDKMIKDYNYPEEELREWFPVYGKLWGILTMTRELSQIDLGKLKSSIFTLETECRGNPSHAKILKPRLLNRYFWLLDYYDKVKADPELKEGVLQKIHITDPQIYERYIR